MANVDVETKPMLEVHIAQEREGSVEATAKVWWCVDEAKLRQTLQDEDFKDPYVLLVVRYPQKTSVGPGHEDIKWVESSRYLVPLTDGVKYIRFKRPGENQLVATIVDLSTGSKKSIRALQDHTYGGLFDYDDNLGKTLWDFRTLGTLSTLSVKVPSEMFAKEPAEWRKKLVARFSSSKAVDQCSMRRRTIASLIWLPFFIVLGTLYKMLTAVVALVVGLRGIAWFHLFHPFTGEWNGLWEDSEHASYWFHKKSKDRDWRNHTFYKRREFPQNCLNPLVLGFVFIGIPSMVFAFVQIHMTHGTGKHAYVGPMLEWGYWKTLLVVDLIIIGLMVAIVVIAFVGGTILNIIEDDSRKQARKRKHEEQRAKRNMTTQQRVLEELQTMVCNDNGAAGTGPVKEKRSISLLYAETKSRVCRPFAS